MHVGVSLRDVKVIIRCTGLPRGCFCHLAARISRFGVGTDSIDAIKPRDNLVRVTRLRQRATEKTTRRGGMRSRWQKAVRNIHGEVLRGPDQAIHFHASECIDEDQTPPNRKSSRPCLGDRSSWHDRQDPSLTMSNCTTSAAVA